MSEEAAFLNSIRQTPGDDTVRLVYADWLDEHDKPALAEFLRVQCEMAQLMRGAPDDHDAILILKRREKQLLATPGLRDDIAERSRWLTPEESQGITFIPDNEWSGRYYYPQTGGNPRFTILRDDHRTPLYSRGLEARKLELFMGYDDLLPTEMRKPLHDESLNFVLEQINSLPAYVGEVNLEAVGNALVYLEAKDVAAMSPKHIEKIHFNMDTLADRAALHAVAKNPAFASLRHLKISELRNHEDDFILPDVEAFAGSPYLRNLDTLEIDMRIGNDVLRELLGSESFRHTVIDLPRYAAPQRSTANDNAYQQTRNFYLSDIQRPLLVALAHHNREAAEVQGATYEVPYTLNRYLDETRAHAALGTSGSWPGFIS